MCGIVVIRDTVGRSVPQELVARMTRTLVHRGPDDDGIIVENGVGLGARRLAILDLTMAAHQPMESPDGQVALVFNGQIFNYLELRQELGRLGHRFRSTGDTEVLLHSYLEWGTNCLTRLNGEWAFVLWDRRTQTLFGARDRFGIKPLYRVEAGGRIAWASEIKALLGLPGYRPGINWNRAGDYLRLGQLDHTPETLFQEIRSVPAGHAFVTAPDGQEKTWAYWSLPTGPQAPPSDPAGEFAELFEDAVRLRLRSDVPLGICLSGGLDSTAIICAAARYQPGSLTAFSYHHPDYDETRFVSDSVAQTGARLNSLTRDHHELWDLAERVIRAHDEPVHTLTPMVQYELMTRIREAGIRVVLNGQGADELLAGYDTFFVDSWYSALRRGHWLKAWTEIQRFTAVHGGESLSFFMHALRRVMRGEFQRFERYRSAADRHRRKREHREGWFTGPALPPQNGIPDPLPLHLQDSLRHYTLRDPLPLYLRMEDRSSMANSVEARVPFLDYRLVELAFRTGPEWKIRGPWNKFLLRESMRGRIPDSVRNRPDKMGFPTPTASLLRGGTFERLFALVSSQRARERGIYAWDRMVSNLWSNRGKENYPLARQFFRVAQFELWASVHQL